MSDIVKHEGEIVELEGIKIKRDQIELIKRTIFVGATDDELRLFFYECARRGTHPMDRLIYPIARKDKDGNRRVTFQSGIDYLRAAAEETGRYVGQKSVEYGPNIAQPSEGGEIQVPEWAEVTVLRKDPETGEINEIPFRAFWREYYPGEKLGHMWRKMPHGQLSKCAEAGALRKGFPRKLGGLYVNEEMEQAEAVPFGGKHTAIQEPKKKQNGQLNEGEDPKSLRAIITVDNVSVQDKKKDGTAMKSPLYSIHSTNGVTYKTFDRNLADLASGEKGKQVEVFYEKDQYGNTLKGLSQVQAEIQQELPNG